MPLTVVAGLPGSGAQDALNRRLVAAVRAGRSALLVVPTAAEAVRARRTLSIAAPVGLRIATLAGLAEAEWAIAGDGRRFVRGLQRDILLARSLAAAGDSVHAGRGTISLLGALAARVAAAGARSPERVTGVAGSLLAALAAYRDLVAAHGLIEPAEAMLALARLAPPAQVVGVDGFFALDPAQLTMIVGWAASGASVTITLPWSEGVAAALPVAPLVARLKEHGADVVDLGGPADERPAELGRIATDLFAGTPPRAGEGRVRTGVARGAEGEARLVARFVEDLTAGGAAPERIAIALPDARRNLTWFLRALTDAGLSVALDVGVPVTETPFGRAMIHLWTFCRAGMAREDLTAYLRTPFSGVPLRRADEADAAWRRGGITGGEGILRRVPEADGAVSLCREAAHRAIDSNNAKTWKSLADELLKSAHPGMAPVPDENGALDAAVHRAFLTGLEQAVQLGEGEVTADELWAAFAASSVNTTGPAEAGRVLLTSLDDVWRHTPDHVVVPGLTAAEMPRRGSDDRLEGDSVKGALSALGLTFDTDEHLRRERLAFYLAVSTPRGSVALVRRESDDEGRALRESVFWDEFLDLYRKPGSPVPADADPRLERDDAEAGPLPAAAPATRGAVRDPRVMESLSAIGAVGPGEVELYAACPYRWYVERRLRQRSPDVAVDPMAAGRVAHDALARFYEEWMREGRCRVTRENVEEAMSRAKGHAEAALGKVTTAVTLEERRLLAGVTPSVISLVSRDAEFLPGYRPVQVEWSFGSDGDDPVDLGGVLVKGRADRIDVGPQGLVVIDYKRSHAASLAEIERDRLVQLQLYAAAASARLGIPVAGGLYRSLASAEDRGFASSDISDGMKARDVLSVDGIAGVIREAVDVARDAVEGMRAGHIAPAPSKEHCAHCQASTFCSEAVRS